MKTEERLVELEAGMRVLRARVTTLEQATGLREATTRAESREPFVPTPVATRVDRTPPRVPSPSRPAPAAPTRPAKVPSLPDLEDLIGGRVLAWLGGAAVVLGLAFFFAMAMSRGWISEAGRTALGGGVAFSLLMLGIWLREQRGRNEAAMTAAAVGTGGLFMAIVVAAQVYELIPAALALGLALVVGLAGTGLALRWNAVVMGALGTIGTVLAPVLAGASMDGATACFLLVATAAGAAVLIRKRWTWLAFGLFLLGIPQWAGWAAEQGSALVAVVVALAFGVTGVLAAVGFDVYSDAERLRPASAFLLALNTAVVAVVGWVGLDLAGSVHGPAVWLAGLGLLHAVVAGTVRLDRRISRDLSLLSAAVAVVLLDLAWGALASGPAVTIGWAGSAVVFAWVASRASLRAAERHAAIAGLGGQIAVAIGHVLATDLAPTSFSGGVSVEGAIAVAALAAGCLTSARFADAGHPEARVAIDIVGLAAVAWLTVVALDGPMLAVSLAAESAALATIARMRRDQVALGGAVTFLAFAAAHAFAVDAPPVAFLRGAPDLLAVIVAIAAVGVALTRLAAAVADFGNWRRILIGTAAITTLYGVSIAVVTAFQPGTSEYAPNVLDVGVRQQGQMLVSGLWSLVGAAALVLGLRRDSRDLRLGGLALLGAAIGKVFLLDLATLTSVYRVASFIGVGVVLLAGSYAWQRLRPAPLPDLRDASC